MSSHFFLLLRLISVSRTLSCGLPIIAKIEHKRWVERKILDVSDEKERERENARKKTVHIKMVVYLLKNAAPKRA